LNSLTGPIVGLMFLYSRSRDGKPFDERNSYRPTEVGYGTAARPRTRKCIEELADGGLCFMSPSCAAQVKLHFKP
jgi:hypothetical protein